MFMQDCLLGVGLSASARYCMACGCVGGGGLH